MLKNTDKETIRDEIEICLNCTEPKCIENCKPLKEYRKSLKEKNFAFKCKKKKQKNTQNIKS